MAVALVALLAGAGLLGVALSGALSSTGSTAAAETPPPAAPAVVVVTPTPAPAPAQQPAPVAQAPAPARTERTADERRFTANDLQHVPASWVSGFYDIYAAAQRAYGVNWLLIASVHKQETAFSTHPTTYHGLNFAGCCAGPMQFNVTNGGGGSGSTWARYRTAGTRAARPAAYPHKTEKHPSVYDDYDAIMAAAALLRDSGAGRTLDASAWRAAYDYYGHDLTGVSYANEVLARAIGWGQRSFCINCSTDQGLLSSVDAAWGTPVRAEMTPPAPKSKTTKSEAVAASKG
ncbi:MAG TPA: hypothetical protein VK501_23790 [Baekduia sp.]|uniref:hypothetical protein n=1 Tax=Baekduia sp. TaxID=2600305 RepID=UPI002CF3ACA7|nr:hypothetical protein [Baekduia sp.]HMJ36949.1 hypothetical protein [Baekduia sp.]